MRITRIYHPGELVCGKTTRLESNASNHLIRVLRTKIDSPVILFNGDGFDYHCKTIDINPKKTSVSIESSEKTKTESNLVINLIQGLSCHSRMETTIQKSVELGASKIVPVICQRSNTRLTENKQIKKLEHWKKVAISACEQSGRCVIPEVTEIVTMENISEYLTKNSIKFTFNPEAKTTLKDIAFEQQAIEIFIGPEGGLNDSEVNFLQHSGFKDICFGPRILRTETAGPAVISALQILWGDF